MILNKKLLDYKKPIMLNCSNVKESRRSKNIANIICNAKNYIQNTVQLKLLIYTEHMLNDLYDECISIQGCLPFF